MKSKSKVLISLLIIGLAAILIGGATSAWFTDEAEVGDVQFKAGTLAINVDENANVYAMKDRHLDNVNPGDCANIVLNIENVGTKKAFIRAEMTAIWEGCLNNDNVKILPAPNTGWKRADNGANGVLRFYYDGEVPGTYGDKEPTAVPLELVVVFDGEKTTNAYQGKMFTLGNIKVSAIQVTNGALEEVWGDDWANIFALDYQPGQAIQNIYEYFETGYGATTPCWLKYLNGEDPVEPELNMDNVEAVYDFCGYHEYSGVTFQTESNDNIINLLVSPSYFYVYGSKYTFDHWEVKKSNNPNWGTVFYSPGNADFNLTGYGAKDGKLIIKKSAIEKDPDLKIRAVYTYSFF
ncbi:MAG: TasA family protein [Desulfitobacteriia bacterium]|jgi:predicted ribosomally synthesized peptide with SipW-like signal peptide